MVLRTDLAHRRLQTEVALDLSRVQRETERRIETLLADEKLRDITPAQANALMILFQEKEPMTARALAGQMNLSEVTVGRFVRALELAGWVTRESDPGDTRAILVRPSRKAYRSLSRFVAVSNALLDQVFSGMTKKEVEALARLLEQVRQNVVVEG